MIHSATGYADGLTGSWRPKARLDGDMAPCADRSLVSSCAGHPLRSGDRQETGRPGDRADGARVYPIPERLHCKFLDLRVFSTIFQLFGHFPWEKNFP
jgi:hypothetical protein